MSSNIVGRKSISLDVMVENKLHLWDFGHADAVSTGGFVFDEGLLSARSR